MQTWAASDRINRFSYTTPSTRYVSAEPEAADYCYEVIDTQRAMSHRDEVLYTFYIPQTEPLPARIECDTDDLLNILEVGGDDQ